MTSQLPDHDTAPAAGSQLRWLLMASHVAAGGAGGGIVRYTVELARSLNRDPGIELHVLCEAEAAEWWTAELGSTDRVHPLPGLPTPALSFLERRGWVLPDLRFDVVQGAKHLIPPATGALRLLTVHDMLPLDRPLDFGLAKRTLLRAPYLHSIEEADLLACVSNATRARVLAYIPSASDHAEVVQLATSRALLNASSTPVKVLDGQRFALVVGDQSPRKNLPLVIGAWASVIDRVPEAKLAVVGPSGWGTTSLGDQVSTLEARGALHLLGHVDDDELRWCYENAAVAAMPSLLEGFGLPAVEARAFGTPLITSEDPALCEAADGYGTVVPTTRQDMWVDSLTAAVSSGARSSPTVPAVARTWDDVANETVAIVRTALNRPASGTGDDDES